MSRYKIKEEVVYLDTETRRFLKAKIKLIVIEGEMISYIVECSNKTLTLKEDSLYNKTDEEVLSINKKLAELEKERFDKLRTLNKEIDEKLKKIFE